MVTGIKEPTFGELAESRRNNFDFMRFVLATLVIFSHAKLGHAAVYPDATRTSGDSFLIIGPGRMGLNWFFTISGFLIANSWIRGHGLLDFLKKRALRIYPALVTALLICILVVGPLGGVHLAGYFTNPDTWRSMDPLVLKNVQPIPGLFAGSGMMPVADGPVWTIPLEMLCYLLVASLGLLALLKKRWVVLGLLAAVYASFVIQLHTYPPYPFFLPYLGNLDAIPRLATFFLCGTTFYLFRDRIPYSDKLALGALAGFLVSYKFFPGEGIPIFGTYLCFYLAFHQKLRLHNWGKYGDFSYGLYLYAWPIDRLFLYRFHHLVPHNPVLARAVLFPITFTGALICAFLSWRFIEAPFLKMKKRPMPHDASPGASLKIPEQPSPSAPLPRPADDAKEVVR